MTKLLVRWGIIVVALIAAAWLLPGIEVYGAAWVVYAVMAVILGLINAVIKPLLKLLTCPLILLTLGLFVLVINAITLLLAAGISNRILGSLELGGGFAIKSFGWAFVAALIVSIVTVILSAVVKEDKE